MTSSPDIPNPFAPSARAEFRYRPLTATQTRVIHTALRESGWMESCEETGEYQSDLCQKASRHVPLDTDYLTLTVSGFEPSLAGVAPSDGRRDE